MINASLDHVVRNMAIVWLIVPRLVGKRAGLKAGVADQRRVEFCDFSQKMIEFGG